MPCFNEADIIEACAREWHEEVVQKIPGSEFILVDDCSTDRTHAVLERLAPSLPGLRVMRTLRNGGHGGAVRLGLQHATQEYVFQTDSDRQHCPADFWKLWEMRRGCDFVFGIRSRRADGPFRILITSAMKIVNLLIWGVWIADANCPFKLMRRPALEQVLERVPQSFIPMVLVSLLSRKMGFRIAEVKVSHFARKGGTQSLKGMVRWAKVGSRCLAELAVLRMRTIGRDLRPRP